MTNDEIILLAIENTIHGLKFDEEGLLRFAKLIAQNERTWVGLADEDIALIDWESLVTRKDCVRAIEAKLKEKNT